MKMKRLETEASRALQIPISLVSARKPLLSSTLDLADEQRLIEFSTPQRKQQWLRGKHAILKLAQKLDLNIPLSRLHPPCTGISLTHNGKWSIAAGIDNGQSIGVDFESWHQIDDAMLRWYLTPDEQRQMKTASQFTRLRLWTIKEALYKANHSSREFALTDFELEQVSALTGKACGPDKRFRYTSLILRQGLLSLAITE